MKIIKSSEIIETSCGAGNARCGGHGMNLSNLAEDGYGYAGCFGLGFGNRFDYVRNFKSYFSGEVIL